MKRIWWLFRVFLLCSGLTLVLATLTPCAYYAATWLAGPWEDPKGDTLVVLAAEMDRDGFPGRTTFRRMLYAALAWREGGFRRILVCGGKFEGKPIASVMREYLLLAGVPAAAILEETQSQSTRENALFSAALLAGDTGSIVLLTSDYHMFRAHRAFQKAGLTVRPRPIPDMRSRSLHWMQRWPLFLELIEESAKIAYYTFSGWI